MKCRGALPFRTAPGAAFEYNALCIVVKDDLAPETQHAFVGIYPAECIDRADGALSLAESALSPALRPTVQPIEKLHFSGYGKRGPERT